ncbi:MAG: hypothetical protein IKR81_02755, partial [Victivallales bacterium]|nr:hypothetical protein [Victivallales bacterium]
TTGAETTVELATGSETTVELATGSETTVELATGAETTVELATGAETTMELATGVEDAVGLATGVIGVACSVLGAEMAGFTTGVLSRGSTEGIAPRSLEVTVGVGTSTCEEGKLATV